MGVRYKLWATDYVYEREYLTNTVGLYGLNSAYLTISLAEDFNGFCYKLIAAIVECD